MDAFGGKRPPVTHRYKFAHRLDLQTVRQGPAVRLRDRQDRLEEHQGQSREALRALIIFQDLY